MPRQNALKGEAQQRSLDCGGSLLFPGGEAVGRSRRLCQPPCRRSVTAEDVAGTPDSNPREHPSPREGRSHHCCEGHADGGHASRSLALPAGRGGRGTDPDRPVPPCRSTVPAETWETSGNAHRQGLRGPQRRPAAPSAPKAASRWQRRTGDRRPLPRPPRGAGRQRSCARCLRPPRTAPWPS